MVNRIIEGARWLFAKREPVVRSGIVELPHTPRTAPPPPEGASRGFWLDLWEQELDTLPALGVSTRDFNKDGWLWYTINSTAMVVSDEKSAGVAAKAIVESIGDNITRASKA